MTDLTHAVHTYLTTAPSSQFVGKQVAVRSHWQGMDNLLWHVVAQREEAVLKLFLDAGQARSRRQFDGQQLFAPLGIAPPPLWVDRYPEGLSRQVLVYRWVDGERLDLADSGQLAALAETVAQVHSGSIEHVRRLCPRPVNLDFFWRVLSGSFAQIAGWLAAEGRSQLRRLFLELTEQADALTSRANPLAQRAAVCPVHGDIKAENVLMSFGAAILVDWEMFGLGDPALDAAYFLADSQAMLPPHAESLWLDVYLARMDDDHLSARISVYRRLLHLEKLCFLLNGLRTLTAADRASEGFRQNMEFLAATLEATLYATSKVLTGGTDADRPGIHDDVAALIGL